MDAASFTRTTNDERNERTHATLTYGKKKEELISKSQDKAHQGLMTVDAVGI